MICPKNKNGEDSCIKCKKVPIDFIPVCDFHNINPDQQGVMNCEDCHTCDTCKPRKYWE